MNSLRKLALVSLFSLGLLLLGAAAPAVAKTFYGDLYLGFSINADQGLPQGLDIDLSSLLSQGPLPFRAKVYCQDGLFRLDVDLPNLQELAGSADTKSLKNFQVLTLLADLGDNAYILLNHSLRQAYRLHIPAELMGLNTYKDPYALLTSKEYIDSLSQGDIKYAGTKRIKSRTLEGTRALGLETTLKMNIPKEEAEFLIQQGASFSGLFKFRYYYEPESKFPLLYEMDSEFIDLTMQIVNIKRDRLPEVMFEIPPFYTVKDYSAEDLADMMLRLASDIPDMAGQMSQQKAAPPAPATQEQPVAKEGTAPAAEGGAEEAAPEGEDENHPADAPPGPVNT